MRWVAKVTDPSWLGEELHEVEADNRAGAIDLVYGWLLDQPDLFDFRIDITPYPEHMLDDLRELDTHG